MAEESAIPDVAELARRAFEAATRGDLDTALSVFAPDAVWDRSAIGLGTIEGLAAIGDGLEEWWQLYEEYEQHLEEVRDLGYGVTFAVARQKGRPVGSIGQVQLRYAAIIVSLDGLVKRFTTYTDIDEVRAAAERLAQERG